MTVSKIRDWKHRPRRRSEQRAHRMVIVVPGNGALLEVAGLADIFSMANRSIPPGSSLCPYRYVIAAVGPDKVVRGSSGMQVICDETLDNLPPDSGVDTVIVVGAYYDERQTLNRKIAAWLEAAAPKAERVASICKGVFFLAEAGLLKGRRVTTHWQCAAELAARYPETVVDPDPIFIQDGKIFTSAGVSAGLDLGLAFVETDLGKDIALSVARSLVLYLRRPGGQSQFSAALKRQIADPGAIRSVQTWVMEHLADDLCVGKLATVAAMSPRNFARVFVKQVGITPARYVEEMRIAAVRDLLEESDETIDRIASACGFSTAGTMRRLFERYVGVSPGQYRARFRTGLASA